MVGFEKALRAVKVIKDQIQYRSQSLLNLARGYSGENYRYAALAFNPYICIYLGSFYMRFKDESWFPFMADTDENTNGVLALRLINGDSALVV